MNATSNDATQNDATSNNATSNDATRNDARNDAWNDDDWNVGNPVPMSNMDGGMMSPGMGNPNVPMSNMDSGMMGMNPSTGMMMNNVNNMKKQYNNFKM